MILSETARDKILRVLRACEEKLALYRAKHGGEYLGGVEYSTLMEMIQDAKESL